MRIPEVLVVAGGSAFEKMIAAAIVHSVEQATQSVGDTTSIIFKEIQMKARTIQLFKELIRHILGAAGYDVVPKGRVRSWRERLIHAKRLGFRPQTILDGGAFRRLWSKEVTGLFPGVQIVLVEPNPFLYVGSPSPRDLLDFMYDKGFCLYDIVDCYNRPYDDALAGGDFFFVRNSSKLRGYQGWE